MKVWSLRRARVEPGNLPVLSPSPPCLALTFSESKMVICCNPRRSSPSVQPASNFSPAIPAHPTDGSPRIPILTPNRCVEHCTTVVKSAARPCACWPSFVRCLSSRYRVVAAVADPRLAAVNSERKAAQSSFASTIIPDRQNWCFVSMPGSREVHPIDPLASIPSLVLCSPPRVTGHGGSGLRRQVSVSSDRICQTCVEDTK